MRVYNLNPYIFEDHEDYTETTWINLNHSKSTNTLDPVWLFVGGSPGYIARLIYKDHINLRKSYLRVYQNRRNLDWVYIESFPLNLVTVQHSEVGGGFTNDVVTLCIDNFLYQTRMNEVLVSGLCCQLIHIFKLAGGDFSKAVGKLQPDAVLFTGV